MFADGFAIGMGIGAVSGIVIGATVRRSGTNVQTRIISDLLASLWAHRGSKPSMDSLCICERDAVQWLADHPKDPMNAWTAEIVRRMGVEPFGQESDALPRISRR